MKLKFCINFSPLSWKFCSCNRMDATFSKLIETNIEQLWTWLFCYLKNWQQLCTYTSVNFCWLLVTTEFQLNNSATAANIQVCSHEIHFNRWFGLQVGLQIKECNFGKYFYPPATPKVFMRCSFRCWVMLL